MDSHTCIPARGQIVAVRQRLYILEQSRAAGKSGGATLVGLSYVGDGAQGQQLEFLCEAAE
jgi:hypothetical protein